MPCRAAATAECASQKIDARIVIEHVIDGDTLIITNGEKLRLIGIDTPELGYRNRPAEPGALAARTFVRELLKSHQLYALDYGIEEHDHHGRRLGHLFLEDGENVQARLLAMGLATPLNIPPNLRYSDCYRKQANTAKNEKRGLWQLRQYQASASTSLDGSERGYRVIYGSVTRVNMTASSLWLDLGADFAVRVARNDLQHFPRLDPGSLRGQQIEVRGKLYYHRGQLRLRLRHHNDLRLLGSAGASPASSPRR